MLFIVACQRFVLFAPETERRITMEDSCAIVIVLKDENSREITFENLEIQKYLPELHSSKIQCFTFWKIALFGHGLSSSFLLTSTCILNGLDLSSRLRTIGINVENTRGFGHFNLYAFALLSGMDICVGHPLGFGFCEEGKIVSWEARSYDYETPEIVRPGIAKLLGIPYEKEVWRWNGVL